MMNILVVGGGKLVYFLSRTFISKGHTVTVINRDREECTQLSRRLKATVVYGDGSDPQILREAGADTADAVLSVTPNDQDNLVICQLADIRFHVPRTLALVNDPDNEEVFRQLGITAAFSTTRILSNLIEQRASFEDIINLIPVGEGKVNVTEVVLGESSPVVGRPLIDIALPENSLIATIMRNGQPIVPRGATVLQVGDRLIVMTLPENHGQVLRLLTGDTK
jgi:trk system potassium uptake protein TrkA